MSQTTTDAVIEGVFGADYMRNPHRILARLRAAGPVHRVITPNGLRVWLVTRHADVRAVLSDPRMSKDMLSADDVIQNSLLHPERSREFDKDLIKYMLNTDPPDHTRLRKLVSKAFTLRRIEQMRPRIEQITDELIAAMPREGVVDLIDALAFPMPITVICEMLGIPTDDRDDIRTWTNEIITTTNPERVLPACEAMIEYLGGLIEERRRRPTTDMLTALIQARDDEDRLDEVELISMIFLLLVAGHETTVNLLGNGTLALLRNPDQLDLLRSDLSLLHGAMEEMVRYDGSFGTATYRYTKEPVDVGGVVIPGRQMVLISLLAANRDPDQFPDPDRFDIRRDTHGHVGFGHGVHYCIGVALARLEGEIAFSRLLRGFPRLRLAVPPEELSWRDSILIHGLTSLPVRLA